LPEALGLARKMAAYSQPAARLAKECVNAAYETPLQEGLRLERRCFHATFALADQKEGMGAFAEKREPNFTHK
jgi:enoyl-CoA hydratase